MTTRTGSKDYLHKTLKSVRSLLRGVKKNTPSSSSIDARWRIFDREFYLRTYPDIAEAGVDCYEHYYQYGWREGRNPHPLFNTQHYLSEIGQKFAGYSDPLTHYEHEGHKYASPHPLFDRNHYLEQSPELGPRTDALAHYLFSGGNLRKNPHRLFETAYYLEQNPDLATKGICLLAHYLEFGWKAGSNPNYLFDAEWVNAQLPNDGDSRSPLERFLSYERNPWVTPHPVFNAKSYAGQLLQKKMVDSAMNNAAKSLAYYLTAGWREDISPCTVFDFRFYRLEIGGQVVDPLFHYFCCGGFRKYSFNPAFELKHYLTNNPELLSENETPLVHLLRNINRHDCQPNSFLDAEWYLSANKDIKDSGLSAAAHYVNWGVNEERRRPNSFFSPRFVIKRHSEESFATETAASFYFRQKCHERPRILFVGHDATPTGAPKILLRLIQEFGKGSNIEPFLFLMNGGSLLDKYRECAHTHLIGWGKGVNDCLSVRNNDGGIRKEINRLLQLFVSNRPMVAICNTVETVAIAGILKEAGIPVITLVHEMAIQYAPSIMRDVNQFSDRVIFSSIASEKVALAQVQLNPGDHAVASQGLLEDSFGSAPRKDAREEVISTLRTRPNAFIVLGCGNADQRKGFDLFCEVAARIRTNARQSGRDETPLFVWVGGCPQPVNGERNPAYGVWWSQQALRIAGAEKDVIHIEHVDDTEPYFLAADLFFLPSRADPFPNVVLEAMACAIPVVYFKDSGGAEEAVGSECGIGVAYSDVNEAAKAIESLASNGALRREMGQNALARIKSRYKFHDYLKNIAAVCSNVSGREVVIRESEKSDAQSKKIIFLSADWIISGVNTFTEALVSELNRLGYQASILFTAGRFTKLPPKKELLPQVPKEFLQPESANHRAIWASLMTHFEHHERCIVVPNHDFSSGAIIPLLPSHIGAVCIAHSDDDDHYEQSYRLGTWCNRIVTVSDHIRRRLIELNGSFSKKTSTIHYGVNEGEIDDRTLWDVKFNKGDDSPIELVYSGRFVMAQKRIDRYVELAQMLSERNIPFRLTLIGDGPEMDWVRSSLSSLLAADVVRLPGRLSRSEIDQYLEKSHMFVLFSEYEGMPVALLEAMSRGCVSVVMKIDSGVPDIIQHGENGFICDQGDLKSAADLVVSLASDRQRLRKLAEATRKSFFDKKLTVKDMAQAYAALFDEVFEEITNTTFQRPRSLGHRTSFRGAMPPPWLN